MIDIVCATRLTEAEFHGRSALGRSLARLGFDTRLRLRASFENSRGLPEVYNASITAPDAGEALVFVHDDVWLDDQFLGGRVIRGLKAFDVIGVAGNRRRVKGQPGWAFVDTRLTWDDPAHLSGAVAHGKGPLGRVSWYGPTPTRCELLDGVFLAASRDALLRGKVLFDPCFAFHFYDLDFCRTARQQGLKLGTWPICLTHESGGSFRSEAWRTGYMTYLDKWERGGTA